MKKVIFLILAFFSFFALNSEVRAANVLETCKYVSDDLEVWITVEENGENSVTLKKFAGVTKDYNNWLSSFKVVSDVSNWLTDARLEGGFAKKYVENLASFDNSCPGYVLVEATFTAYNTYVSNSSNELERLKTEVNLADEVFIAKNDNSGNVSVDGTALTCSYVGNSFAAGIKIREDNSASAVITELYQSAVPSTVDIANWKDYNYASNKKCPQFIVGNIKTIGGKAYVSNDESSLRSMAQREGWHFSYTGFEGSIDTYAAGLGELKGSVSGSVSNFISYDYNNIPECNGCSITVRYYNPLDVTKFMDGDSIIYDVEFDESELSGVDSSSSDFLIIVNGFGLLDIPLDDYLPGSRPELYFKYSNGELKLYASEEEKNDDSNWVGSGDPNFGGKVDCSQIFSDELVDLVQGALNFIRFLVPILLIGLSIMDYVKALASQEQDAVKKATTLVIKRGIIAVAIFLVSTLLYFVFDAFGIEICANIK